MSKVLLVWSTYTHSDPEVSNDLEDHWTAYDFLAEAQEAYYELMKLPELHSASVCGVIQSTDYLAMPEFYLG